MRKLFIASLFVLIGTLGFSQHTKIGYVDVDYMLFKLPEAKKAQSELETIQQQYQQQLLQLQQEAEALQQELQNAGETLPQFTRTTKEDELKSKINSFQSLQANAQNFLGQKQVELLNPILDKIQENINGLAKELNYDYILLNGVAGTNFILYAKEENNNLTVELLKRMGVSEEEAKAETASNPNTIIAK